jgi:small redox-active disulfide protein 2
VKELLMEIKILGTGCARCKKLYDETATAIARLGVAALLAKVEKLDDIMAYKVLMTPALVIDDEIKAAGRIPSQAELTVWITTAATRARSGRSR